VPCGLKVQSENFGCGSALLLPGSHVSKSGRGLPQSKTLALGMAREKHAMLVSAPATREHASFALAHIRNAHEWDSAPTVGQVSKPAVSPISNRQGVGTDGAPRIGNPRYSRLGGRRSLQKGQVTAAGQDAPCIQRHLDGTPAFGLRQSPDAALQHGRAGDVCSRQLRDAIKPMRVGRNIVVHRER
jgi:hypothetical protein